MTRPIACIGACDAQAGSLPRNDLCNLYREHRWFLLRDAIDDSSPWFYRGAVAGSFGQLDECRRWLNPIIQSMPDSRLAYDCHNLLSWAYIREGKFRDALPHIIRMRESQPQNRALQRHLELFTSLSRLPEQAVLQRRPEVLRYSMVEGNMFVPACVNGVETHLMVDTGATLCFVTTTEAERLGLKVCELSEGMIEVYGATGSYAQCRVGVAERMVVGGLVLSNVCCMVVNNRNWHFPPGYGGALGLSALVAAQTLSWNRKGEFKLAFSPPPQVPGTANICFDGAEPLAEVLYQKQKLDFVLDTGSGQTVLTANFAARFSELARHGQEGSSSLSGITGAAVVRNLTLPDLMFEMAETQIILRPAHVLLSPTTPNSKYVFGRFGIDLLNQAEAITLDFRHMRLVPDSQPC
jgi:clan AA aspartic protease (TIGR02281 family)